MYLLYHPCIPWVSSQRGRESQILAVLCEDRAIYVRNQIEERGVWTVTKTVIFVVAMIHGSV